MQRHCEHQTRDGKRCQAYAIAQSAFCFFHDPTKAEDRLAARRAGGRRNKGSSLPTHGPDCELESVGDVLTLLATTINQLRKGQIDPRIANGIAYITSTFLRALELRTSESRLDYSLSLTSGARLPDDRKPASPTAQLNLGSPCPPANHDRLVGLLRNIYGIGDRAQGKKEDSTDRSVHRVEGFGGKSEQRPTESLRI